MRELSTAALAAIRANTVIPVLLVEMDLTQPLNLNHSRLTLTFEGIEYLGTQGLGQVQKITDTASELPKLAFEMSGVPSDKVSLVLSERVKGKDVRVKLALVSTAEDHPVLAVVQRYAGWLDTLSLVDGATATVRVTAESATLDLLRPSSVLYTHADQQLLSPGDLFFQYANPQADQRIVWPAATWGRR